MKRRYGTLPTGEGPLPVVNLALPDAPGFQTPALIDSGAAGVRLDAAIAPLLGIDVDLLEPRELHVAGHAGLLVYPVPAVRLRIGELAWTADVTLVLRWPFSHALLGTEGFLDHFDVRLRLRQQRFDILR